MSWKYNKPDTVVLQSRLRKVLNRSNRETARLNLVPSTTVFLRFFSFLVISCVNMDLEWLHTKCNELYDTSAGSLVFFFDPPRIGLTSVPPTVIFWMIFLYLRFYLVYNKAQNVWIKQYAFICQYRSSHIWAESDRAVTYSVLINCRQIQTEGTEQGAGAPC
jgi:hypothetical protein